MVSAYSGPPDMDDAKPLSSFRSYLCWFQDTVMSTVAPETPPSGPAISLKNLLLLDYPEEAIILRSQDSYDFRVPKLYITHSSPILREKLLISPDPPPGASVNFTESDVKESTGVAKGLQAVQLPVTSTILISLLTYIFPVPPILPSTTEQIMGLLSVAQMYKMEPVLTHIRNHIAQQNPPLIRKETAFSVYALAQQHGLRTEALQAARCTLSFSTMIIEKLAEEEKLGLMPGAFLHELWKYHQRVRESLTSDIEEFLNKLEILKDTNCFLGDFDLPFWFECYVSDLGKQYEPFSLDFTRFNMRFVEHSRGLNSKDREECASCSNISQEVVCAIWDSFTAVVQGCIAKAESDFTLCVEGTRFEHEVQPRLSSREASSLSKYSDMPNADIILQSSDLVNFRVHRLVLVTSSPFFRDMFSLPQPSDDVAPDGLPLLHLSETAEILNSLISMLYPVLPEMPRSMDNTLALLAATEKYDMGAIQSFIRAEVSCKQLLSPSDSGGAFHMFTAACSKQLIPEMETAARLTLGYPLTFESVGEALRTFDGEALCGLFDFRKRCVRKLESLMESFSDNQNGPSTIWAGCRFLDASEPRFDPPQLPWWLALLFEIPEDDIFTDPIPTSVQFRDKFLEALQNHINHKDCHFCLKVYALKGEAYCAELENMMELARNVPFRDLGESQRNGIM